MPADRMKILALVMVATIIAGGYLTATAFVTGQNEINPEDIVRNAVVNIKNMSEYNISYSVYYTIKIGTDNLDMNGTIYVIKNGNSSITKYNITSPGKQSISYDIYDLPSGLWQCFSVFGSYSCSIVDISEVGEIQSPIDQSIVLEESINNKTLTLHPAQSRTIMSRKCLGVLVDYDETKLSQQMSLEESGAVIESLTTEICYDKETSIPLFMEIRMNVYSQVDDQSSSVVVSMSALSVQMTSEPISLPVGATIF